MKIYSKRWRNQTADRGNNNVVNVELGTLLLITKYQANKRTSNRQRSTCHRPLTHPSLVWVKLTCALLVGYNDPSTTWHNRGLPVADLYSAFRSGEQGDAVSGKNEPSTSEISIFQCWPNSSYWCNGGQVTNVNLTSQSSIAQLLLHIIIGCNRLRTHGVKVVKHLH